MIDFNVIKKLYGGLPYPVKAPFAKTIRNKLIKNPVFAEQYGILESFDKLDQAAIEAEQTELLKETLSHAYEHTVYYRKLFDSIGFNPYEFNDANDLKRIPILKGEELKDNFSELVADDIGNFYSVMTGGTTGPSKTILMESAALYKEWAFVYHFWSKFGYDYNRSKLATFRGINFGGKICAINPLYKEIRMNSALLNETNLPSYLKKINNYGADFIYGYPSAIYNFCKAAKRAGIQLDARFKAVFLVSENLYPFQRELIEEMLKCPIAMFYGHTERATIAESSGQGYKFNPLYGFIETSDEGEPIVTGFINKKMPLIRYLVDDTIKEIGQNIYSVEGHRDSSVVYGKSGTELRAGLINFHGLLAEKLGHFQLLQNKPGELIIMTTNDNNLASQELDQISRECESRLSLQFDIVIECADSLIRSNSGTNKYRLLVQNYKPLGET